jgi:hypothetical protein
MSDYPAFRQTRDSTASRDSGHEASRATNGRLHVRRLWDADKTDFEIGHVLTAAEKTQLEAFYAANRDAEFNLRYAADGQTYVVRFTGVPRYVARLMRFEARVKLAEA